MDSQAAQDYHKALIVQMRSRRSGFANLWWIPAIGFSGYYAFETTAGLIFSLLVGYAFCAVLTRLDRVKLDILNAEFLRHLHEHTDEFAVAEVRANLEIAANKYAKKWFD